MDRAEATPAERLAPASSPQTSASAATPAASRWPLLVVALGGIALSGIAFFAVHTWEQRLAAAMASAEFQHAAQEREARFRREIDSGLAALQYLSAFARVTGSVRQLNTYSEYVLANHPGLQTLAWVPRIQPRQSWQKALELPVDSLEIRVRDAGGRLVDASPDGERFPIVYLASYSRPAPDPGLDLGIEAVFREAIAQALSTGTLTLTRKLPPFGPDWPGYDVAALVPIFSGGGIPPTQAERRRRLEGFLLGGYRLDKLVARALAGSGEGGEHVRLWIVDPGSAEILYRPYLASNDAAVPDPEAGGAVMRTATLSIGGRSWSLLMQPDASPHGEGGALSPWIVLGSGLALTFLLVWYLAALRRQSGALVATNRALNHEVSERRRTEAALRASESRFRKVLETAADAILIVDSQAKVVIANGQAEQLLGYSAEELLGMPVNQLVPPESREAHRQYERELPEFSPRHWGVGRDLVARRKDGSDVPVEITLGSLQSPDGLFVTAILRDITEYREAEQIRERLSAILEATTDFAAMAEAQSGRLLYLNAAGRRMVGIGAGEDVTATQVEQLLTPESMARLKAELLSGANEDAAWSGELVLTTWDGRCAIPVSTVVLAHRNSAGELTHFSAIARDITESKRTESHLRRINRTHAVLSECNQALVRAISEEDLLRSFCSNLVEVGGYRFAWVGYIDDDSPRIRPVCEAGFADGYLDEVRNTCDETPLGQGPVGRAVRTGLPAIVREIEHDPLFGPWAEPARLRGYRSVISFPLESARGPLGALSIYAGEKDLFDEDEVALLKELAADLAYGIRTLRSGEARHAAETGLMIRNRALQVSRNGVIIADATLEGFPLIYVNPAFEQITGYGPREALGRKASFLQADDRDQPELQKITNALKARREGRAILRNYRKDGSLFWNELFVAPVHDDAGKLTHYVGILNDITEHKRYEEQLEYQAQHDELTGLPNRNLLQDRIDQALVYAGRYHRTVAVLFLDLDQFKVINDTLGHRTGDELLKVAAKRLVECGREGDTVARYGGDEFVVLLPDLIRLEDVNTVAERILEAIAEPVEIGEHRLETTVSIGATLYPRDGGDSSTLLKNADAAMYRAKELGRNSIHFYTEDLNTRLMERLTLERQLRRAIEREELLLHYQPQIELFSGEITGLEALVRWDHPELGLVSPGRFIPLAEETGLIVPLGDWVLRKACEQNRAWQVAGLPPVTVAVNLSARQLGRAELFRFVRQVLDETGLDPKYLELELTESSVMEDPTEMLARLRRLKEFGVRLSIDDFGTGYSSLSQLKRFPFDKLKIDQSFVRDITTDPDDAAIAVTIIGMAKGLNLRVIAEGVESEGQLRYLMRHGCHEVQGYLFSRACTPEVAEQMLREQPRFELPESTATGRATVLVVASIHHPSPIMRCFAEKDDSCRCLTAATTDDAFDLLARHRVRVVIADQHLPGMGVTGFLRRVGQLYPGISRVLVAEHEPEHAADGIAEKVLVEPSETMLRDAIKALCAPALGVDG